MSSSMLQLVPDFLAGVVRLHDLLAGVCFVLCFAGLTILAFQALREHSVGRTWPGMVQLILGSVLLGNLPTWCDAIMDGVQDLVHQCGWSDFPGSVYQAYDQAIATKFGTASLGSVSEILHGIGGGQTGQTAHGVHAGVVRLGYSGGQRTGQYGYWDMVSDGWRDGLDSRSRLDNRGVNRGSIFYQRSGDGQCFWNDSTGGRGLGAQRWSRGYSSYGRG